MTQQEVRGKQVRRVTQVDITRNMKGAGEPGSYQFELSLDEGVEEYILIPAEQEVNTLLRLFRHSESVLFDKRQADLIFQNYHG